MRIVVVFVCFIVVLVKGNDPCSDNKVLPHSSYRGTSCAPLKNKFICDKYIQAGWYKLENNAVIVNESVRMYRCDTIYPMWMKGELPQNADVTNATVCIKTSYKSGSGDCDEQIDIKVKKCSSYYVYYLQPPEFCEAGYCFGKDNTCPPFEPCDFYYHDQIDKIDAANFCDLTSNWYVIKHQDSIPVSCPDPAPNRVWMNVSSVLSGQTIDAHICIGDEEACCKYALDIQVKNCSGVLAYNISTEDHCLCSGDCVFNDANSVKSTVLGVLTFVLMMTLSIF